ENPGQRRLSLQGREMGNLRNLFIRVAGAAGATHCGRMSRDRCDSPGLSPLISDARRSVMKEPASGAVLWRHEMKRSEAAEIGGVRLFPGKSLSVLEWRHSLARARSRSLKLA